jgi:exo-1,4-beta-D-glucosaminidase
MKTAHLIVSADLKNATSYAITGILKGEIETIKFEQAVELKGNSTKRVTFNSTNFQQLNLSNPRVWWPAKLGKQNLYQAKLEFITNQQVSDSQNVQFGIREVSSELTVEGNRLFKINGEKILIRGAMWWPDMLLRSSPQRQEWELRYALDMNLNLLRMDGKFEDENFLEMCDRYGMLLMPGWCCGNPWEQWEDWDKEDYSIASTSLTDQIRIFRNHPSLLTFLLGDDNAPPLDVEKIYTAILKENDWPNPYQTDAAQWGRQTLNGPTGYRMTGPYMWVPPSYWLTDQKVGGTSPTRLHPTADRKRGAFGFLTETSPTAAVPPVESLRKMLPSDSNWPINDSWNFHSGGGVFSTENIKLFTEALNARLGQAQNLEDYAQKAQLMSYEAQRAMFEAYGENKYLSTGVVHEMLNNAWPSLIWNLYDYYLCPAGAYFGTKKACEPLHVQYAYDKHSIFVVNSLYKDFPDMKVTARVLDMNLNEKFSKEALITIKSDTSIKVFSIPEINGISTTYFVLLRLDNPKGDIVSSNFYWLSTKMDSLDWDKAHWYYTPTKSFADLTGLKNLKPALVKLTSKSEQSANGEDITHVKIENPSNNLAFFLRLRISKGSGGEEVLPILWQDNYFSLMPGEIREITATYKHSDLNRTSPVVEVEGWNVKRSSE